MCKNCSKKRVRLEKLSETLNLSVYPEGTYLKEYGAYVQVCQFKMCGEKFLASGNTYYHCSCRTQEHTWRRRLKNQLVKDAHAKLMKNYRILKRLRREERLRWIKEERIRHQGYVWQHFTEIVLQKGNLIIGKVYDHYVLFDNKNMRAMILNHSEWMDIEPYAVNMASRTGVAYAVALIEARKAGLDDPESLDEDS